MIYFDNAATSFPKPERVYEALDYANRNLAFNAGRGSHKGAKKAQEIIELLKKELNSLVGVNCRKNIQFYDSATIASNVLIFGLGINTDSVVYLSPFEHNAIARPLEMLKKRTGCKVKIIPFDKDLSLNKNDFKHMLSVEPADYIFITAVGNVLGNVVDVDEVIECCDKPKPIVVVDVAQALGVVPIDFQKYDCEYMIFAGHKTLYGPLGIGGIISRKEIKLEPYLSGGTGINSLNTDLNEAGEIGSPNIVAVYGLLKSIEWLRIEGYEKVNKKVVNLARVLVDKINQLSEITVFGDFKGDKHTGIVSFVHEEYSSQELSQILDVDFDIAVRGGYQCAPYIHKLIGTEENSGVVRISLHPCPVSDQSPAPLGTN